MIEKNIYDKYVKYIIYLLFAIRLDYVLITITRDTRGKVL